MFQIMLKNFWRNTYKRNEPTRTQATQTLKNQRGAMVSAFTEMLDNNKNHRQRNHQMRMTAMKKKRSPN